MELRQLRYFKVIADAGSFARGAQDLRVAQPALSRSIAKLEGELRKTLFVRHSTGVSLTDEGARLYEHAVQVLERLRELEETMAEDNGAPTGVVALGAPSSIQSKLALPVAAEFLSRFRLCRLDLVQNTGARLRQQVAEGLLDVAIVPAAGDSGPQGLPLVDESICLILPSCERHRFGEEVQLEEVVQLPLILTGYPDSLRRHIGRQNPALSDSLQVRSEVNSSVVMLDLVRRGAGFGVAPSCVVANPLANDLAFVPIAQLSASWEVVTNWQRRGARGVFMLQEMILRHTQAAVESGLWSTAQLRCRVGDSG